MYYFIHEVPTGPVLWVLPGPQVRTGPWHLVSPQFKAVESYTGPAGSTETQRNEGAPGGEAWSGGAMLGWQPAGLALCPGQPSF